MKSKQNLTALPTLTCIPKRLPKETWIESSELARQVNPLNFAPVHRLAQIDPQFAPDAMKLAVMTTKYWGLGGKKFGVSFLDGATPTLRRMILEHMNAWSQFCNVQFVESADRNGADVRVARLENSGYWSYLGTDIRLIRPGEPTMNLEGFTEDTEAKEFRRVVRHEAGHTLGFPHEHMRRELVQRINREKAIAYFHRLAGWSPKEVEQQVLTPLEESSLLGTPHADHDSIMCYQIPGEITEDGKPIPGGKDIDAEDQQFAAKIYPLPRKHDTPVISPIVDLAFSPQGRRGPLELLQQYLALQHAQTRIVERFTLLMSAAGHDSAPAEPTSKRATEGLQIDIETTLDRTLSIISDDTGRHLSDLHVDMDLEQDLNYSATNKKRLEGRIERAFDDVNAEVDPNDLVDATTIQNLADRIYSKYIPESHRK